MPAIVGANGVDTLLPIPLDEKEQAALQESAATLRKVIEESIDF
jgi:L-lactate dehydrogenase